MHALPATKMITRTLKCRGIVGITLGGTPLTGTVTLADTAEAHLLAGKVYFNLHTTSHPTGEIRGQVAATKD